MSHTKHELFGPVTALHCGKTVVLFAVANRVYATRSGIIAADSHHTSSSSSLLLGQIPDGCVVTTLEDCGPEVAVAGSADTLFLLSHSQCRRLGCARGARFVAVAFDDQRQSVLAIAANGAIFVVPIDQTAVANESCVHAFDAGVLLAGNVLRLNASCSDSGNASNVITFFGATYAGTVLEYSVDVPRLAETGHLNQDALQMLSDCMRHPVRRHSIVAHHAGCAIFAVSSVALRAPDSSDALFMATCSDDRSVALFRRVQHNDSTRSSEWTLFHRLQGTTFARCRVFDVCLLTTLCTQQNGVMQVLCGAAGEDGTVQAFRVAEAASDASPLDGVRANVKQVLYRPSQHDGHGAWKVGFTLSEGLPALVSAGFDGAVVSHPVGAAAAAERMRTDLSVLLAHPSAGGGRRSACQVRCVCATPNGLIACCTQQELILCQHHGDDTQLEKALPRQSPVRVALHTGADNASRYLPSTITSVLVTDASAVLVIGTDRGACVLVHAWTTGSQLHTSTHVCTTLSAHQKWLAAAASSASARVASAHLDGAIVVSAVELHGDQTVMAYTLRPLFQCLNGPGRMLTALSLVESAAGNSTNNNDDISGFVVCGDKRGSVYGYALSACSPGGSADSVKSLANPSFSEHCFAGGQSVCTFSTASGTSRDTVVCVLATDGLYVSLNVSRLCRRSVAATPNLEKSQNCPLRLPMKVNSVLAASADVIVTQHATTVSVHRRACDGCWAGDWVQVAVYEDVRAPRLLSATISLDQNDAFTVHCSDGVTVESYASGKSVHGDAPATTLGSRVLRCRVIAGKDYNACLFLGAPLNALACAGEDTGLLIANVGDASPSSSSLKLLGATTLYGPHHSNILALCELPNGSSGAGHRLVTVGGLATVVVWEWTPAGLWRAAAVLSEEDAQDPSNDDRIPRFLSVRALGRDRVVVGSSDGTVRLYTVAPETPAQVQLVHMRTLNVATPKPVLALGAAANPANQHCSQPTAFAAGDTNGNVYLVVSPTNAGDSGGPTPGESFSVNVLHVERSAVNAVSDIHMIPADHAKHTIRFACVHDSGTAYVIGSIANPNGFAQLHVLSSLCAAITPGRGVSWPRVDAPITVATEEMVVRARWDADDGHNSGILTVLTRQRPNVRCVSGLAERAATDGQPVALVAVVGQGLEVVPHSQCGAGEQ